MVEYRTGVIIIFSVILLATIALFIFLTLKDRMAKIKKSEQEIIERTEQEYEEYKGEEYMPTIDEEKSILDLMLKFHKKEMLKKLNIKSLEDLDYVILTYLNSLMKNTFFEQYPFWTILHPSEAVHSLHILKNALTAIDDEKFTSYRDVIFAWLNYVFDLDEEIVNNREYILKDDLIKIIEEIESGL